MSEKGLSVCLLFVCFLAATVRKLYFFGQQNYEYRPISKHHFDQVVRLAKYFSVLMLLKTFFFLI